jgi:putative transcriptional regulator
MSIQVTLDRVLVERHVTSRELALFIGITEQNLSLLKSGKVRGIRFATLARICEYLECQPGEILRFVEDDAGAAPVPAEDECETVEE